MPIPGTRQVPTQTIAVPAAGSIFCFCVDSTELESYVRDFIRGLDPHLPEFVFSRDTIRTINEQIAAGLTTRTPVERARDHLQKTQHMRAHDSGEAGEFLLYLFSSQVLGAVKVISKIQGRGSIRMPVLGRDGVFAWRDATGTIHALMGEAKVRPNGNDGLRNALEDINAFWTNEAEKHEIHLAAAQIRSELTPENVAIYEAYFLDDNPNRANLRYRNICFVGYSSASFGALVEGARTREESEELIRKELSRFLKNQAELIANSPHPTIFCFIPFECAATLRTIFAQHHELEIPIDGNP
jgi:hypothetical protein